jgi:seryl-tRNA synthetase
MNNAAAKGFPTSWREVLNEMQREWDRLHQEIAALRTERDQLSKALLALLSEEVTLTQEEILAQVGQEKPLREFLQEMRAELVKDSPR